MLQTKRLILREWLDSDIPPFIKMGADPRVMEFFPDLLDEEGSRSYVEKCRKHFAENGFGKFAIELRENGEFIGCLGLVKVPFESHFTPAVEIGWRLASQHFSKGYATEGAREVLRFAFEDLHLKEVVSFTVPENKPSRNVMEKIGMTHDEKDDFLHPKIPQNHKFSRHVLYRIKPCK
jgi:RimJ/RimL family protein N-acetyltransferase